MYEKLEIFKRVSDVEIIRYFCLRNIVNDTYGVQSVDHLNTPIDEISVGQLDSQFFELLLEELPEQRTEFFSTLKEAISNFEVDFGLDKSF